MSDLPAGENEWGHDPVLTSGGLTAFRAWVAATTQHNPGSLLARLKADGPVPAWAKIMFLDSDPSHARHLDLAYRRSTASNRGSRDLFTHSISPSNAQPPSEPPAPPRISARPPLKPPPPSVQGREPALALYSIEREGPLPDIGMFYGLLGRIVREVHPFTEGDPVGVLTTLLSAFSAAVGHGPHIKIGSSRHPLLVWTMLIGRTALGRKGTATSAAMDVFERVARDFTENHLLYGSPSSGAGLVGKLEAMAGEADWREPGVSEETPLRPGFPALMIEEEWAKVMRRSRIDYALGQNLRVAWQGNTLSVIVKKKADCATVPKAHVAIVGHVTPDEFRANLSGADVAGGTFNRFLPIYVHRCQSLPLAEGLPEHRADELAAELRSVIVQAKGVGKISLDDAAEAYWRTEMYDRLTALSTGSERLESFAGRAVAYAQRIAALYALTDGRQSVGCQHLKSAESLLMYVIESVEFVTRRLPAPGRRPPAGR